ncbi:MAG: DUF2007 domain-containing protein [Halofilum sp. (in: g-proteobacteria)]|nr:DUF2007 domain-containing protein [Halofilum sp. (in: g-proteobacteria)]
MRRVYQGENLFDAQLVRDRLLEDGIAAEVHGIMLTGAVGEIPADTRPSVWIDDADLYERARQLVARFERSDANAAGWRCPACGEDNGPAFELCWSCGASPHDKHGGNRE